MGEAKGWRCGLAVTAILAMMVFVGCDNPNGPGGGGKGSFIDSRDGKSYKTVKIGDQTWMAENLNYDASGSVCYKNQESNCSTYGRLYDWEAVMNGAPSSTSSPSGVRGVCPEGWHMPSEAEWMTLMDFAGGSSKAGGKLKSAAGWDEVYEGWIESNGTDNYGFSALPGGYGLPGGFVVVGKYGQWWSATEGDANNAAWWFSMTGGNAGMDRARSPKTYLLSVRCLLD
ncbi:MAG: fibrobacter succinogenes major paralogous domain-containing protein [Chitinispirillia bacterium]|nr:fibrobacter succinogenes major paralogous domain-containing protein [Chitinispirillia bacterium]MCL2269305.1 fibrobacter succinogenes major paralogous domain-containing protein [Chitinispirillia bacterium]